MHIVTETNEYITTSSLSYWLFETPNGTVNVSKVKYPSYLKAIARFRQKTANSR